MPHCRSLVMLSKHIVFSLCVIVGATTKDCHIVRSQDQGIAADCERLHLNKIPSNIPEPSSVTSLQLSRNNISSLEANAFALFPQISKLNISAAGINALAEAAFRGLGHLKVLDLSNNPVLQHGSLPQSIFGFCPTITHLYISGAPLLGKLFQPLENLEELTMTPVQYNMPYEVGKLPKLRVLNFAFGQISQLTKSALEPFANTTIEEIAFHACNIKEIEHGTFDDFRNLRLLNFACNKHGSVDNILEVLSTNRQLKLESLILDAVGMSYDKYPVMLGMHVNGSCHKIWNTVRNLSLRGINLLGIQNADCFKNLQSVSAGFNTPFIFGNGGSHTLHYFTDLMYLDMSYAMVNDDAAISYLTSCQHGWVPPNHSFFTARVPEWESITCVPYNSSIRKYHDGCHVIILPSCLLYVRVDHAAVLGNTPEHSCSHVVPSSLKYLNVSFKLHDKDWKTQFMHIDGLDDLEICDVSDFGLAEYNPEISLKIPAIREFYMSKNNIGHGTISQIPHLQNLTILDISSNKISVIEENAFSNLPNLKILDLSNNYISSLSWLSYNFKTLNSLEMRNNKLQYIDTEVISMIVDIQQCTSFSLDIRGNPLQCNCAGIDFLKWMRESSTNIASGKQLTCNKAGAYITVQTIDVNELERDCSHTSHKIILSVALLVTTLVLVGSLLLIYKYRWKIKWKYYKARYISGNRRSDLLLRAINDDNTFSAFIIYPYEDDEVRRWVFDNLRIRIESDWQRRECFIRGRNDSPGATHAQAIAEGIYHSQTALWVVCPSLFDDGWCEIAMNFAFHHLGIENNVLLMIENRLDQYRVPNQFVPFLSPSCKIPRLRYPNDEDGQRLFWASLEAHIPI